MSKVIDELTLTEVLGKGAFGEVYLTTNSKVDGLYATKKVDRQFALNERNRRYFNNEIFILKNLKHDNIIRLCQVKQTTNNFYLVFEFCNGGSLSSCLKKYQDRFNKPFPEDIAQHLIRQIVNGIAYLQRNMIIHRDLKLDNVLVSFDNEDDKTKLNMKSATVKIIDFGFARYLEQDDLAKSILGSPINMDPAILANVVENTNNKFNKGYDEKADIWSLGTICYQLLVGYPPFTAKSNEELYNKILNGVYKIPLNLKLSIQAISFISGLLQNSSESRNDIKSIYYHEFLNGNIQEFKTLDANMIDPKYVSNNSVILSSKHKVYPFLEGGNANNRNTMHSPNKQPNLNNQPNSSNIGTYNTNQLTRTNSNKGDNLQNRNSIGLNNDRYVELCGFYDNNLNTDYNDLRTESRDVNKIDLNGTNKRKEPSPNRISKFDNYNNHGSDIAKMYDKKMRINPDTTYSKNRSKSKDNKSQINTGTPNIPERMRLEEIISKANQIFYKINKTSYKFTSELHPAYPQAEDYIKDLTKE